MLASTNNRERVLHPHDEQRRSEFLDASVVTLLADATLPCQHLDAAFVQDRRQQLDDEKQIWNFRVLT
jgi:hypothetical protein